MLFRKKLAVLLSMLCMMMILMSSAHADLITINKALQSTDKAQTDQATEREDVQHQLVKLGVDPASAKERVNQLTDAEVAEINGRLEELPAGAGISTVDLLLIIIIILLI
jgi:septal ring factor EnvC (AmiA/AmiB activator)